MDTLKNKTSENELVSETQEERMTRKEVLKKIGYGALTATTLMVLMKTPARAQGSPAPPPPWGQ